MINSIRVIAQQIFSLLDRCSLINPGKSSVFAKWLDAERRLADITPFDKDSTALFNDWKRIYRPLDHIGYFKIKSAMIISKRDHDIVRRSKERHAIVFSRNFRPVRIGRNYKYHYELLNFFRLSAKIIKSENRVIALLGAYYSDAENYFHFWIDVVGDLIFLKKSLAPSEAVDCYVIPFGGASWQKEILEMCGIEESKIIPLNSFDALNASCLIVPIRNKGGRINHTWIGNSVREYIGWQQSQISASRKIYITRLDSSRRPLHKEDLIIEILKEDGFEIITCSGLTVKEQQKIFSESSLVVAPHGAALTNIIWMSPGTTLLEFIPVQHANPCFRDLAYQLDINYYNIPAFQVNRDDDSIFAGIEIDIELLEKALNDIKNKKAQIS